jgi:uncharacterized protein (DUF1015 family)
MAVVKPFKAYRPIPKLASKVAALPYDVMNSAEARKMVKGNPYSFLHVDKAEIDLDPKIDLYDPKVYQKAKINLERMMEEGVLLQDPQKCFYIYRITMGIRSQTGLVCCTSVADYQSDIIKKHEQTREDKEMDRIQHVDICDANTGPIFLTYKKERAIEEILHQWTEKKIPDTEFVAEDGVSHAVWVMDEEEVILRISKIFSDIPALYIADGHHRAASAVKVAEKRRRENPENKGTEEYHYFLSVLFADSELTIMDYNRVIKDLNGFDTDMFFKKVEEMFWVKKYMGVGNYAPNQIHQFGMFLDGTWYILEAKEGTFDEGDPVESLDVSILQNNLLDPILGIQNPRIDKRIDFVGGIRGLDELVRRVNLDMRIAFSLYPTSIEALMKIADSNQMMPPKSTWFEPKLRSGLFIHKL